MQDLNTTAKRQAEVERIKRALKTSNPDRVLSAMGHPGYGREFAAKALYEWCRNPGASMHQVVYSGCRLGV